MAQPPIMVESEYDQYDAVGLAGLIAKSELGPSEPIEAAISRIESRNPRLNAVVAKCFDAARGLIAKGLPDGPLAGVPYLVKDLNTWLAGVPATNGSQAFAETTPESDGILVSRLKAAGLVILGKTNTPEFGLNICTAPKLFGPTVNPFDATLSAGGSSGGSACAVASGMLPAAHATDSGGSIRIPASNCGLFGLKPSRGLVPLGHDRAEGLAGFSVAHAVTHSVRDSAMLLDVTHGPIPGAIYSAPDTQGGFLQSLEGDLPQFKVGLCTGGFAGETIDTRCEKAAIDAGRLCESVGCVVEEVISPVDGAALREAFDVLFSANIASVVGSVLSRRLGQNRKTLFEPLTIACAEAGQRRTAVEYVGAIERIQQAADVLGRFFLEYDVLLTPTLAKPPLKLNEVSMNCDNWLVYLEGMLDEIPFTPLFNATGAPAASVPLSKTEDGLPIGIQIGAALGQEKTLLRLARAFEVERPWHSRI